MRRAIRPSPSRSRSGLFCAGPLPRLYDRSVEALRVRHDSPRTGDAHLHRIGRFIVFHGRGARPERASRDQPGDLLQGTWSIARSGEMYFPKRRRNDEDSWPVRKSGNGPLRGGMLVCVRCCSKGTARCRCTRTQAFANSPRPFRACHPPGQQGRHHVHESLVQKAIRQAIRKAGLTKRGH